MEKTVVVRNFSKCAYFYDRYADIQKFSARALLSRIKEDSFETILELGCGTGNYTVMLRDRFKTATLRALDISEKMIEVASNKLKDRDIEFITADAQEVNLDKTFDLITSNACFQWFADLEKALIKYKELLNKNGVISFSTFGPLTFWELDVSLKCILQNVSLEANNFIVKEKIKDILNKNFNKVRIEETMLTQVFFNLRELLDKIRYSGIRGNGLGGKIYFNRRILKNLEEAYLDRFKQLKATYQIFFCQGLKSS